MAIVDDRGDSWSQMMIRGDCLGYVRDIDQYRWPIDPRVPGDTSVGWCDSVEGYLPVNRALRLPPTVSEIAEEKKISFEKPSMGNAEKPVADIEGNKMTIIMENTGVTSIPDAEKEVNPSSQTFHNLSTAEVNDMIDIVRCNLMLEFGGDTNIVNTLGSKEKVLMYLSQFNGDIAKASAKAMGHHFDPSEY